MMDIFLDVQKAFDSVNHELLLKKNRIFRYSWSIAINLLRSFLSERTQK